MYGFLGWENNKLAFQKVILRCLESMDWKVKGRLATKKGNQVKKVHHSEHAVWLWDEMMGQLLKTFKQQNWMDLVNEQVIWAKWREILRIAPSVHQGGIILHKEPITKVILQIVIQCTILNISYHVNIVAMIYYETLSHTFPHLQGNIMCSCCSCFL